MSTTRTALVIGGGIAGSVAAMALRKAGVQATVYEGRPSAADGVGAGLGLAPNGLNALATIDAADAVAAIGEPMRAIELQSWNGRRLATFPSPPGLPVTRFVWRAELYRVLSELAAERGVPTVLGKRLAAVREEGEQVVAVFADGDEARADILIGADGIRSTTRALIDPGAPRPRHTGLMGFGGKLADTGLPGTDGTMVMSFGKRAFFGYQVYDDGSGGWFVNLPAAEPMSLAQVRAVGNQEWLRRMRAAFAADRSAAPRLLDRVEPDELMVVGSIHDIPRVPTWRRGRVVLVGDAAHATSPSSGQGASLAIESAVQLARCLRDLPHEQAFAAYENMRRARVERIIALAARTNSEKAAGPVARLVRDAVLPLAMRLAKPDKRAWQTGYRVDWDAPVSASAPPAPAEALA